jgi:hypothetical protein
MKGADNAVRWDEGTPAKFTRDASGKPIGGEAQMNTFKKDGASVYPAGNIENMEYWWHTHPDVTLSENYKGIDYTVTLGGSNPSDADYDAQEALEEAGFKKETFVVGVGDKRVTFYRKNKNLVNISWRNFKRIGEGRAKKGRVYRKYNKMRNGGKKKNT